MSSYLSIKNWDTFQQYKDRDPKWIKLHRDILNDYEFDQLTEIEQCHLMKIWLLASKLDNKIPNDPSWIARQIGAKSKVNVKQLVTHGFLLLYESVQKRTETYLETETETYREETETDTRKLKFAEWWDVYAKKVSRKKCEEKWAGFKWEKLGVEPDDLIADARNRHANCNKWPRYQPDPITYLNGERWHDELQTNNGSGNEPVQPWQQYEQERERADEYFSKVDGGVVGENGDAIQSTVAKEQRAGGIKGIPRLVQ